MNCSRGPNGSESSSKSSLVIPPMSKRIETEAGLVSAAPTHSSGNFEIEKGWQKNAMRQIHRFSKVITASTAILNSLCLILLGPNAALA